ncbi:MAG: terminase family protein [Rhizobiaceae bacterium]|nr:terminase family protein [Rhizobiaceae bacterium]
MRAELEALSQNDEKIQHAFVFQLHEYEAEFILRDWPIWGRSNQFPQLSGWKTWILLGGRGAGKTRAGAEWIRYIATLSRGATGHCGGRIALIGESYSDVRDIMIEGQSGLLSVHRYNEMPKWHSTQRKLEWPNGAIGQVFSSRDPDGLRGAQFGAVWCDELCKWSNLTHTWDMLQFCLRVGDNPRQLVTTTPKPSVFLKNLIEKPGSVVKRSTTRENKNNLAPGFIEHIENTYSGTRLGRQELEAELIEDREDGLWNRTQMEKIRRKPVLPMRRIVIAVDPPATSKSTSAACGIIVAGNDANGRCFVIADKTIAKATPLAWANKVVAAYHEYAADLVVAEIHQGGEMVETILHTTDPSIPVRPVHAQRSKWTRAEPVALLYEKEQVSHARPFPQLEDQMCAFGPDGLADGLSPDRVDALVWAITELELKRHPAPRIRAT